MERGIEAVAPAIATAAFDDLPARTLYGILRLRSEVFVVEQGCVFLDLDGRDHEPGARHCWIEEGDDVVACLRILHEPGGASVGRVVTSPGARRRGLGAALVRHALAITARPVTIHAQSHLAPWYGRFGFAASGPEFVEDGIPHTPMVLA